MTATCLPLRRVKRATMPYPLFSPSLKTWMSSRCGLADLFHSIVSVIVAKVYSFSVSN